MIIVAKERILNTNVSYFSDIVIFLSLLTSNDHNSETNVDICMQVVPLETVLFLLY